MFKFLFFIAGAFLGGFAVWFRVCKYTPDCEKEIEGIGEELEKEAQEEEFSGLEEYNAKKGEEINQRKEEILRVVNKKGFIKTGEVSDMFDVSRNTAYRYLSELEKEGKIKQTKKFGRRVRYILAK
ncbi:MAG: DeoR family transcriptional regulator [Candidatus Moraniibacteriota bacterium]